MGNNTSKFIFNQSGVIPFTRKDNTLKILLITSLSKKNWIIPKGIVEEGLSPRDSALKEAYEEAGIGGKIAGKRIGIYAYDKWGGTCQVKVYACQVTKIFDDWPEKGQRQRQWFAPEKVPALISNHELRNLIMKFIDEKCE